MTLYHEVSLSRVNIPNSTFKREINTFALFFSNKTFHKFKQWIAHMKREISIWISQFPPINYTVLLIHLNLPTTLNTVDDIYSGNVCWSKLSWCSIKSFQSALYENTSLKNVSHYEYLGSNACWMQSFIQDITLPLTLIRLNQLIRLPWHIYDTIMEISYCPCRECSNSSYIFFRSFSSLDTSNREIGYSLSSKCILGAM